MLDILLLLSIIIICIILCILLYNHYLNKSTTKSIILDNYGTYIDLNFKQQHITGLPVNIKAESVTAIFPGCNENVDPIQCSNGEFLINGYIHNGSNLENVKVGVFNGEFIAGNYYNVTLEESK